jgi:pimeloyl-ACP methyl ester carboxylesterase
MFQPIRVAASGLAFLLVAGAATAPLSAQEIREGDVTTSDGVRIHYFDVGRDTGLTPLVMIHGYTANSEWKWIKPGIAQALAGDRRVIAVDARGHGKSEKPHDPARYGPRMAEDVVEVMDALGIERAHVHGFSMGGSILTQILINHPERVATAIYGGSGVAEVDPAWVERVPEDPEAPEGLAASLPGERWSTYPGFDREAMNAVQGYPWTAEERAIDLSAIHIPVMAIIGGYDGPNRRTHRMARELHMFELVVLPGETHGSSHFNPGYTETLLRFVRANDAAHAH